MNWADVSEAMAAFVRAWRGDVTTPAEPDSTKATTDCWNCGQPVVGYANLDGEVSSYRCEACDVAYLAKAPERVGNAKILEHYRKWAGTSFDWIDHATTYAPTP